MSLKKIILIIISRLLCGIGMSVGLVSIVFSLWCFFVSHHPDRFLWGGIGVLVLLIGYGIYKFSLTYIYDEWEKYR
ncbi:hypothetical protein Cf24236_1056 [Citrobacter farmeri]|uniref:Uncharacterized protein n=1 Tax=Citrobacter farmeri TaxID=67824 RepID=A0ACA8D382_9ENTR|nr:hypothetical protein CI104_05655 [Citrobacter farmeri]HAU5706130.1 hypothetical protein [Citrobacter freundii]MCP1694018.1 uncharacterized membrane protein YjfL (UPF0719 family) [Citrobacter farmeri]MCW2423933.1 uncharacterized membrane protein YjfL (UPF0719 family) [Citrobacter farmeri]QZE45838.1 hypothetical protein Cf24236_1056 [Citrobacter farmeri]